MLQLWRTTRRVCEALFVVVSVSFAFQFAPRVRNHFQQDVKAPDAQPHDVVILLDLELQPGGIIRLPDHEPTAIATRASDAFILLCQMHLEHLKDTLAPLTFIFLRCIRGISITMVDHVLSLAKLL